MSELKLVPIRNGAPLLNDIAGQIEQVAKGIRDGKHQFQRVVLVAEDYEGDVQAFSFGEMRAALFDIGLLDCAKDIVKDCLIDAPDKVPA